MQKVQTQITHDAAKLPEYQTPGAAAVDLATVEAFSIRAGETKLVKTGLKIAVPKGYVGLVCSRSGLALKASVFVLNAPGVVDCDYRGEVGVILMNLGTAMVEFAAGDRIAQLMLVKYEQAKFTQVESLDETQRGEGGFGSTGITQ